ncbi:MAG: lipoprotein-releasing system ATP-binding protein LolD [Candidatus Binatia bacterium]|nr:MAG: lipoprotein-releasing system ATP-binding protein LolD [Candidatus Binatia bacterium]
MSEWLIRAEGLCKVYGDGHAITVLDHLDLEVREREVLAIVGQSGVGKSTLLHILGTLDVPSAGRVWFQGKDLFALDEVQQAEFRNREIGFVFQFHHLLPDFDAVENVMMPALVGGMRRSQARVRAQELLARVGLADRMDHRPGQLSGGELQRVAIARALVLSPKAILADEPTGNLDPETAAEVHDLLLELNRERGTTLVLVTHNEALARLAHRVLRLHHGKLHPS